MIRYALKCRKGHDFDGWFRSSEAFEAQAAAGHVACSVCGSPEVEKALMAPSVPAKASPKTPALAPASPREAALAKLRKKIETSSDYVGKEFAAEARKMHDGDSEHRSVWGEASIDEAKALHDDGIPAVPIPWMSRRDD